MALVGFKQSTRHDDMLGCGTATAGGAALAVACIAGWHLHAAGWPGLHPSSGVGLAADLKVVQEEY